MSKHDQVERIVIQQAYEIGGFPLSKKNLIRLWNMNERSDFDELVEKMRAALMSIESENMSMEQISSAAHICAVVAYKP